jgi:hypothetical protein
VKRRHIRIAMTEADGPPGISARGFYQPVAVRRVLGDDCDALGLKSFEYFRLGVGDRLHRSQIFDVGRRKRSDHGDVWTHQSGQRGDLARPVHPHFEHCKFAVARHPGEAERNPGVVVVAFDRAVDLALREPL